MPEEEQPSPHMDRAFTMMKAMLKGLVADDELLDLCVEYKHKLYQKFLAKVNDPVVAAQLASGDLGK